MTSGPLFDVVQSIKGLVLEVLDESQRALERVTISETTTLVEISVLFGALAAPIAPAIGTDRPRSASISPGPSWQGENPPGWRKSA